MAIDYVRRRKHEGAGRFELAAAIDHGVISALTGKEAVRIYTSPDPKQTRLTTSLIW